MGVIPWLDPVSGATFDDADVTVPPDSVMVLTSADVVTNVEHENLLLALGSCALGCSGSSTEPPADETFSEPLLPPTPSLCASSAPIAR